jgi:holo-[acyl-carrier protein] synthase
MIGLGVDLVEVPRFREVLARTPSIVERLFTDGEVRYAGAVHDPTPRLAVRFAAKEATLKSLGLGLGGMPMSDIEVVRDDATGRPALRLHRRALEVAAAHGVTTWQISLSHTDLVAQATVIAL